MAEKKPTILRLPSAGAGMADFKKEATYILNMAALAIWSGILLYFSYTGRLDSFLVPRFHPLVIVTGHLLAIFTVCHAILCRPSKSENKSENSCPASSSKYQPHYHSATMKSLSFFVLVFPLIVAACLAPTSFGRGAIDNRQVVDDVNAAALFYNSRKAPGKTASSPHSAQEDSNPLPFDSEGNIVAEIVDLAFAASEPEMKKALADQPVVVIGQYLALKEGKTADEKHPRFYDAIGAVQQKSHSFKLVRLLMVCCAADARPFSVTVEIDGDLPDLQDMTWVKVYGILTFPFTDPLEDTESGSLLKPKVMIKATKVAAIEAPKEPFLH